MTPRNLLKFLHKIIDQAIDEPGNHCKLAVSSLKLKDVERTFEISRDPKPPTWWDVQSNIHLAPEYAGVVQYEYSEQQRTAAKWTVGTPNPVNDTTVRMTLNYLLFGTLKAVQDGRPATTRQMKIQLEAALAWSPVKYKLRKRCLHGYATHILWYGSEQQMETNLVLCMAKRSSTAGSGAAQLLAYMAIIRSHRMKLRKADPTVYGVCSDKELFHFYRLDRWGKYSVHAIRCVPPKYEKIVKLLGHIIVEASKQCPQCSEDMADAMEM